MEQLQLENENLINVLRNKNLELVKARTEIGSARLKKHSFQKKLHEEEKKFLDLQKLTE